MNLTAIILAGGESSRMGEDKGLMFFEGKPMIQHVIDVVKPMVDHIIIISNNRAYEVFGYAVYDDLIQGKGPLAGIYTGLRYSETDKNLVLSCDVPFVNKEVLQLVIDNCNTVDIVIPEKENRTHQLIGVYDKSCTTFLKKELDNNQRKIKVAIEKLNYKVVDANHIASHIFNNINTKEDAKA